MKGGKIRAFSGQIKREFFTATRAERYFAGSLAGRNRITREEGEAWRAKN
jgi:hypothetical protein